MSTAAERAQRRVYRQAYRQRPEIKAKKYAQHRAYRQMSEEVKAQHREDWGAYLQRQSEARMVANLEERGYRVLPPEKP